MLDVLNLSGAVVTLDALHCQRETLNQAKYARALQCSQIEDKMQRTVEGRVINVTRELL